MAGKAKKLSQMVNDVKKGDRVMFSTDKITPRTIKEPMVENFTGYCTVNPSPNDPKGKKYYFSNNQESLTFLVCPTNKSYQLKPTGRRYRAVNHYRIISRTKNDETIRPFTIRERLRAPIIDGIKYGI